jgi:D-alanyl-D-alanine carboxypeptidase
MIRPAVAVATLALLAATGPGFASQKEKVAHNAAAPAPNESNNRLMIINGNSGRVIYDDGLDDLFCVTRRYFVGWDYYGRRLYRRAMGCR